MRDNIETPHRAQRAGRLGRGIASRSASWRGRWLAGLLLLGLLPSVLLSSASFGKKIAGQNTDTVWQTKVSRLAWVAYSPSNAGPDRASMATRESIRQDLAVLRDAGFTGLVTYSAAGAMGTDLPELARQAQFEGLILGVWDPYSAEEIAAVQSQAQSPIVLGFCVGNEGLGKRYGLAELSQVIADLRLATGKPVTTTEEIGDYSDDRLMRLGDWVFPNVHPIHDHRVDAESALRWTEGVHQDLLRRTDRFVLFKEVGLPAHGDDAQQLSEASQRDYYLGLADSEVRFVYFEAFDQPWKDHLPFEPHWGLFRADRTPKNFARGLLTSDGAIVQRESRAKR